VVQGIIDKLREEQILSINMEKEVGMQYVSQLFTGQDCPHKEEAKMTEACEEEQYSITIFTKGVKANEMLLTEEFLCAGIDTACTSTVRG